VTHAGLVVALANAQAPRRPPYARAAVAQDALADARRASELLEPFLEVRVREEDLPAVRAVQRAVLAIVDALIDGSPPPLEALNRLAAREPLVQVLEQGPGGGPRTTLRPRRTSAAATLIADVIGELGRLDPRRLRRCARPECPLVFYDVTRPGTQRWHAERPCGLRERQRRHQARHAV